MASDEGLPDLGAELLSAYNMQLRVADLLIIFSIKISQVVIVDLNLLLL
jgi:hypothetical protein